MPFKEASCTVIKLLGERKSFDVAVQTAIYNAIDQLKQRSVVNIYKVGMGYITFYSSVLHGYLINFFLPMHRSPTLRFFLRSGLSENAHGMQSVIIYNLSRGIL